MQVARDQITLPIDTGDASYSVDVIYADNGNNQNTDQNADPNTDQNADPNTDQNADPNTDQNADPNANQDTGDKDGQDAEHNKDKDQQAAQDKEPNKVQKRINTLTKKWRTAEREITQLKKENTQLRNVDPTKLLREPIATEFDDADKFLAAVVDWKIQQSKVDQSTTDAADIKIMIDDKNEAIMKEKQVYLDEVFTTAETKYKDFNTVFNDSVPVSTGMVDSMLLLDNIADVAYYLGKNTDEASDISKMSKVEAAMSLQRISSKLGLKRISKGPGPISPTGGMQQGKTLDSMSYAEYRKEMEKREQLKRNV